MNKTTGIIVGIIIIAVIALGLYTSMNRGNATMETKMPESSGMEDKEVMMKDDSMMEGEGAMMLKGSYETYAPEKLARAETGDVVLFFHALWCPSCRGLNADIEKSLSAIPPEMSILKVDYDTESELKKKYGVTYQHTLVQVDASGNLIKKWSGSPTLRSLVAQIK